MGRKKKNEPIENLGNDFDKLTVQKSKPLTALWQSSLTLAEFKILDTYLGRINSHDDEKRTVKFKKGELESLLEMKQIKPEVLDERLVHLMTTVRIPDENSRRGFTRIALFEKAHVEQDNDGIWTAELTCTESARKYIFNVESIRYLQYRLKNIIGIKSRYSYIVYLYLCDNRYRKDWTIDLDDLKKMLCCENEETYTQFKRFNDLILKKVQKEIQRVTDIRYDYETIKQGRRVVAIRFIYRSKIENLAENDDENQITLDQWQEGENAAREQICAGLSDPAFDRFTEDQLRTLVAAAEEKGYTGKSAALHLKTCIAAAEEKKAAHRFQYIKKMLENEKKKGKKEGTTEAAGTKFNDNFDQRNYDFNDLESKLLAAQEQEKG